MFETLIRLYKAGKLTETGLTKAVTFEWINATQKQEILES